MDPITPPEAILLTDRGWEAMHAAVLDAAPEEACGILAGENGKVWEVRPVENILHSPTHFEMNPAEVLELFHELLGRGLELTGIYHSHPNGAPHPSPADMRGWNYPNTAHLIWSRSSGDWTCAAFLVWNDGYSEISLIRENP